MTVKMATVEAYIYKPAEKCFKTLPALVALCGYSGVGKDEAARALIGPVGVNGCTYSRWNFGDLIKEAVDPIVRKHFGFSAFTENRDQKARIRRTLEAFGEDNYDNFFSEFFGRLPAMAVNTRLVRVKEAEEWKARGGALIWIYRPGRMPATQWETDRQEELEMSGLIDVGIWNDGTPDELRDKFMTALIGLSPNNH